MIPVVMAAAIRVIILPGNGCTPIARSNWYNWLHKSLTKDGIECPLRDMPDPFEAKEKVWLPFVRDTLKVDERTIVVGHSSGAEAAMRLMENTKVFGAVLVAACHTDLGEESEAISGYYARPWEWDKIKANAGFISQFADQNDPFIPFEEAKHVHENLGTELIAPNRGDHFMVSEFPELLEHIRGKMKA